ncbi:group II intron reverse transcriptase/maturase [Clostridium butyricum]
MTNRGEKPTEMEVLNRLMTTVSENKIKKKAKLRHNEYYNIQELFDDLYAKSQSEYIFTDLLSLIKSEENIKLAYRNIKKNKGSKTCGTNKKNIISLGNDDINKVIKYVQDRLDNYMPHSVRRVEIPKNNGKTRPLGIPTIEDRLIQQCIKQILEPICEAKFHNHSYGFRPNRSTSHAIARSAFLINMANLHYVVDIDLKSFFDNVNHSKLIKQMWNLGIRDKNLICVIGKMLRAEVEGIGIPTKGTPQGGILSPLLSNIVLNELDWWVSNQWETFDTNHKYTRCDSKYRALKTTNIKEMFLVRYADDFKIFCRDYKTAQKVFIAIRKWLQKRLSLEINTEKSKITNLRKNYTEFLGFKLKAVKKKKQYVAYSHVSDKSKEKCIKILKNAIKTLKQEGSADSVSRYNSKILGMHNYYKIATHVNLDFNKIAFIVNRCLYNRMKKEMSKSGLKNEFFNRLYGRYSNGSGIFFIRGIATIPIKGVNTRPALSFSQDICNYTYSGRRKIHKNLKTCDIQILRYIMEHPIPNQTTEYNDNRISLYVGQNGLCKISKQPLTIGNMEVHHIKPKFLNGTDEYKNLIFITGYVHKLIHATDIGTIEKYMNIIKPNSKTLIAINKYRKKIGNCNITK